MESHESFVTLYLTVTDEWFKDSHNLNTINANKIFEPMDGFLRSHSLNIPENCFNHWIFGVLSDFVSLL